jgi:putative spermidine/putrescine transport system substrate-binding protein
MPLGRTGLRHWRLDHSEWTAGRSLGSKEFARVPTDCERLPDIASEIADRSARASSAPLVGKHAELGIEIPSRMPTNS